MTHEFELLRDVLLLTGVGLLVVLGFRRLRLPSAAGFIVTGALLGPFGLGLIREPAVLGAVAEFGVVLLLFTVGLEFSLADLRRLGRTAFLAGTVQVLGTAALIALPLAGFGMHPARALFFGMLGSLSSTALVFKLLTDRAELAAPHGRWAAAVLLFQDVMVVPFAILLPYLSRWYAPATHAAGGGWIRSVAMIGALLVAFLAVQRAAPWLVRRASRSDSREAFLLGIVLVTLGGAFLSTYAGLSPALGAFIAGLTLARSELRAQIAADVLPLRDVFSSVWFVSVGMMLDRSSILSQPLLVLGVTVGLVTAKALATLVAFKLCRLPWRVALASAVVLAQVGEFSFVLVGTAGAGDLLGPAGRPAFIAAAVLSLLVTPLLVSRAPDWALALDLRLSRRFPGARKMPSDRPDADESERDDAPRSTLRSGHVVIAGFGLNGRNLARVLRAVHVPHVVVDLDPDALALATADGSETLLGDVTRPLIQKHAGVPRASVLVLALSDPIATRHACRIARALAPDLFVVVRTRLVSEIDELHQAGANTVIPEEFETSIEIFTATLRHLHVPMNVIEAQVRLLREERYSLLRGMKLPAPVIEQLDAILQQGTCDTFVLLQRSPALGRSLGALGLGLGPPPDPDPGGARVIALVRGNRAVTALDPGLTLRAGDLLVIAGTHAEMDEVGRRLRPDTAGTDTGASVPL